MDQTPSARLDELVRSAGLPELDPERAGQFHTYLELLMRWNERMNLTAIRDKEGILTRHFVECIACARVVPEDIGTLLDFGSGAGFPGIPIALCRPEIFVTLAESQSKKAAFLHEALRTLALGAKVFSGRAEQIGSTFDCVTLRAVDRMDNAVRAASSLVSPRGWLALMIARRDVEVLQGGVGNVFKWAAPVSLPGSGDGVVLLGRAERKEGRR